MGTWIIILIALGAFIIGVGGCFLVLRYVSKQTLKEAAAEAEIIKKNKIIEAKEKFIALKAEHEAQVQQANSKLQQQESRLQQRENQLNQKQGELQRAQNDLNQQRENVENQMTVIEHRNKELDKLCKQAQDQLEAISGLSATEAKAQLIENLKDELK